jgi:uncharacterized protein DUF732
MDSLLNGSRTAGIFATEEQIPSLIPVAHQACDLMTGAPGPGDQRYTKTIDLLMKVGSNKNIFQTRDTTKSFLIAAIAAYCPKALD